MNRRICDLCGATISETNTRYALKKSTHVFDEEKGKLKRHKSYTFGKIESCKEEILDICEDCIKKIEEERGNHECK